MSVASDIERFSCEGCGRSWPWLLNPDGTVYRTGPGWPPGDRYHIPPRGELVRCTLGEMPSPYRPAFRMMSHEPRTWLIKDRYTVVALRTVGR